MQPNGIDCEHYVMKNMLDVVCASITKSWMEEFQFYDNLYLYTICIFNDIKVGIKLLYKL